MTRWDIFHADRLELERGLSTQDIRAALARGEIRDDDLVRPAGTTIPWVRITDMPELMAPPPELPAGPDAPLPDFEEIQPSLEEVIPPAKKHHPTELPGSSTSDVAFPILEEPEPSPFQAPGSHVPPPPSGAWAWVDDEEDDDEDEEDDLRIVEDQGDMEILADDPPHEESLQPLPHSPGRHAGNPPSRPVESYGGAARHDRWEPSDVDLDPDKIEPGLSASRVALPVVRSRDRDVMPTEAEVESEAEFSLSRSSTQKIEELDLAPMVDVAFQLVLFFMVTATTVLYKTLEIPKPSSEAPAGAVAQGRLRSLEELQKDFILVEIDKQGAMKLDQQPIEPVREKLVENLRRAREKTGRKAMLLSAEHETLHRHAVLAYDAAHEIGLSIAVAKPKPPQGPAPTLRAAPAAPKPSSNPR